MSMDLTKLLAFMVADAKRTRRIPLTSQIVLANMRRAGIDTWPFWRVLWGLPENTKDPEGG